MSERTLRDGQISLTTRPGALDDAYSSFHVRIDTTLGQLMDQAARMHTTTARAGALRPHVLIPGLSCGGQLPSASLQVDVSQMHVLLDISADLSPYNQFIVEGRPSFGITLQSGVAVSCTASLSSPPIPIGATGLFYSIGLATTLTINGEFDTDLKWTPYLGVTFYRSLRSGNSQSFGFRNGGSTTFTGTAGASLFLGLQTEVGLGEGKKVDGAIDGTLGPEIDAQVSRSTTNPNQTCLSVDAKLKADFSAHANLLFKHWSFELGSITYGDLPLLNPPLCTGGTGPTGPTGVVVTNPGNQTGTVGIPVSLQIQASDTDGGQLTYSASGLPAGLSINASSGLISGTTTAVGNSNVTITANDATGSSGHAAFSWTVNASAGGGFSATDLGTLPGYSYSLAHAVNDNGQVVGVAVNDNGEVVGDADTSVSGSGHAFSWTAAGGMVDLGTLPGYSDSAAVAVNDNGEVVGDAETPVSASEHAFSWTAAGGMVDLGTLGGSVSSAAAVNDNGQIVGAADPANANRVHAALWS